MGQLRLPDGASAGFRLVSTDEFGPVFTMHLYGAGRRGWFLLHSRYTRPDHDPGPQPLGKGQWRTFLGLINGCRFWELPERLPDWDEIVSGRVAMDGWGSITTFSVSGSPSRGVASVLRFCQRLSGLFEPSAPPVVEPQPVTQDAEP